MSVKFEFHDLDGLRWTQTALRRQQAFMVGAFYHGLFKLTEAEAANSATDNITDQLLKSALSSTYGIWCWRYNSNINKKT